MSNVFFFLACIFFGYTSFTCISKLTWSTDLSSPATRVEAEVEGEGEDEAEETEAEGLLVATGVDGDEGAGEGDSPREPPAAAPAAPDAAVPTLLSTSVTGKQNHISIRV